MDQEGDQQPLLETDPADLRSAPRTESESPHAEGNGSKERRQRWEERDSEGKTAPLRYAAPLGGRRGAMLRSLPVLFVLALVAVVTGVYVTYHIAPLLQQHEADSETFSRGLGELIAFSLLLVLFMTCFMLSVFVRPGTPDETGEDTVERAAVRTYA